MDTLTLLVLHKLVPADGAYISNYRVTSVISLLEVLWRGINVGFCQVVQLKSLTETIVTGYTDMTNMRVNVVYKWPQVFFYRV